MVVEKDVISGLWGVKRSNGAFTPCLSKEQAEKLMNEYRRMGWAE